MALMDRINGMNRLRHRHEITKRPHKSFHPVNPVNIALIGGSGQFDKRGSVATTEPSAVVPDPGVTVG
jgi:hypothetical protein